MGRLGWLVQHPEDAGPGELDRLTDAYLSGGRRSRLATGWKTLRQERAMRLREPAIGDAVERAVHVPGEWAARLPRRRRKT